MNSIKYFISLLIFSSFSFANPVETGHANVSIVKFDTDSSLKNELFIGIKNGHAKKLAHLLEKSR